MTELYRLAVIKDGDVRRAIVEQGGKYLPIDILLEGEVRRKTGTSDPSDLAFLLSDWQGWNTLLEQYISKNAPLFASQGKPVDTVKFEAPLAAPGKIVCVGSNFHDHIAEMAIPMVPSYPYSFIKPANNTIRGSGDPVAKPKKGNMVDWEAELAVVIGKECVEVPKDKALDVVAGYVNFNDLSCRDWIATRPPVGMDWLLHKAFDGFAPLGPYLVPAEFVPDPQNLPMRLDVNGVTKQDSSTAQMVFGVAEIIEHLTSIMTLMPGDIIATGTPAGTGHGMNPPEYLKPGDVVEMEIGNLGRLVTPII